MKDDELQEYKKQINSNDNVIMTPPSAEDNKVVEPKPEPSVKVNNDAPQTAVVENTNATPNTDRKEPYKYVAKNNIAIPEYNEVDTTKVSDLIELYVGDKYSKFANTNFNIWAFLFGGFYFFYRKMILYGIVEILAFTVCTTCIESEYSYLVPFLVSGLGAFLVNDLYLNHCRQKIQNIINKNESPDVRIMKCMKSGGASIGYVFLGLFLSFILFGLIAFSIGIDRIMKEINNKFDFSFNIKNDDENNKNETFNGMLIRNDSFKYENIFNIQESNTFKKNETFTKGLSLIKKDEEKNKVCEINLYEITNYKNVDTLANQMSEYYYKKAPIKIEKNNISWYEFNGKFASSYSDIHLTSKNQKIYELIFTIQNNAYETECQNEYNEIFETISFK